MSVIISGLFVFIKPTRSDHMFFVGLCVWVVSLCMRTHDQCMYFVFECVCVCVCVCSADRKSPGFVWVGVLFVRPTGSASCESVLCGVCVCVCVCV